MKKKEKKKKIKEKKKEKRREEKKEKREKNKTRGKSAPARIRGLAKIQHSKIFKEIKVIHKY